MADRFSRLLRSAGQHPVPRGFSGRRPGVALAAMVLLAALTGCQKAEGPAERAGKDIDKAVDQAGQQIEKAGDKLRDATKGERP